jgi:hypothetical protein
MKIISLASKLRHEKEQQYYVKATLGKKVAKVVRILMI